MYILGLNIGHNATACLLKDGKIIACISEERFSRIKNHHGIPYNSIQFILNGEKIKLNNVDLIALDDQYSIERDPNFGKNFFNAYINKSLKRKVFSYLGYKFPNFFNIYYQIKEKKRRNNNRNFREKIKNQLSNELNMGGKKIVVSDHHLMHAFGTIGNLDKSKKWLIFTLDGEGSGLCATVNIYNGKSLRILSKTRKTASLGYFYGLATMYLGMKPLEHEFKVMGLAPYAKIDKVNEVYQKIKKLFWIDDNLEFHSSFNMPFADHFFNKEMKNVRFDTIAGAVQKLTEDICCEWIKKAIIKTGISNVALSGGVFMNVKTNKKISELPDVKEIFVMPSAGDESNAIGSCFYGYRLFCEKNKTKYLPSPLTDLYLGPEYDNYYIEELIERENLRKKYWIRKEKNINFTIARLLAKGEIVARCSGKSEWGARALGNRSILANPVNIDTIRILNETIKDRDFWMPFTPSILDKFEKKYILNEKRIFSPYMAITFDSTKTAEKEMPAAMHPYDFTIRPQIVKKEYNADYYDIIEKFSKLTKIGAVLNTSFNLHGEPNVLKPEDAIHTVENSSLKYLAMGDYLFEKIS